MTAYTQNGSSSTNANAGTNGGANAYLRTKVMTASPEELRLMLLDGAIKFATQGREGMLKKDFEAQYTGISQCRDIVFELLTTIKADVDPDLASKVKALYTFLYTHLTEASFEKSITKLEKVIELLTYERETWVLLMQKVAEERGQGKIPESSAPSAAQKAAPGAAPQRAALSVQG
jgi:flagellar protein FliS